MGSVTPLRADLPAGAPLARDALAAFADHLRATRQGTGATTSEKTVRSYLTALGKLVDEHTPVDRLDADTVQTRFRQLWGNASASTWNVRRAALSKFSAFAADRGWLSEDLADGLNRESLPHAVERSRRRTDIERLLKDKRVALRDRVLWRMLYDTAARAEEILGLNAEDLDRANRQAAVTRKGGTADRITWSPSTARALSSYLGDRTRGPVFLTEQRSAAVARGEVPERDIDPESQRTRLTYHAALAALRKATGGAWTLHDLRHSALTHAAEDGIEVTTLMVKSGHRDIRTLARYARPSAERAQRQWEQVRGE